MCPLNIWCKARRAPHPGHWYPVISLKRHGGNNPESAGSRNDKYTRHGKHITIKDTLILKSDVKNRSATSDILNCNEFPVLLAVRNS